MASASLRWFICLLLLTAGCGSLKDDLAPSGADQRPPVVPGSVGSMTGQTAPDFTLSDTLGNPVTLSAVLPAVQGIVLYFTMWCDTCNTHMSTMNTFIIPNYPNVRFFAIDYISWSFVAARDAEVTNGFNGSPFTVLADTNQYVQVSYAATMATTVVIDKDGVIRMNEDFKDGQRLQTVLAGLP